MRFVDTNVLLYSVSTAPDESAKTLIARELLNSADLCLSVQVFQEFYVQATRPSRSGGLDHEQAVRLIEAWSRYPVQVTDANVLKNALATRLRFQISYWDAAIVESARALGCREILSEDLQHQMDFAGVRVCNPFESTN